MGFRAEKLEVEAKIKRIKQILLWIVLVVITALCIFSAFVPPETWKYHVNKPKIKRRADGELRMHFLDVGQGDCSLIEFPDGKVMLIDGGNGSEKTAKTILRYLNALKIEKIEYLLVTHADSDHCGALDKIIQYKEIEKAYVPNVEEDINTQYAEFYAAATEKEVPLTYSKKEITLSSDREDCPYVISFLYPYTFDVQEEEKATDKTNTRSAVFWLDYFGVSALFAGDAPSFVEEKLILDSQLGLNPKDVRLEDTEILKVAHHGSDGSTSTKFLEYLNVETALISCAEDNLYGHPSKALCERLEKFEIKDYRTYRDGHIIITVNKSGAYQVNCIPS